MKLFKNVENIMSEISDMEKDELNRREDRATVSRFFNGQPPLSQKQADAMGLRVNVNNLFGYTDLAAAKDQTVALYTKPPRLFNVEMDFAPTANKYVWEQCLTRAFNRIVKKGNRMRMPYEGVAGDASMHGEGTFFFPDPLTPYPRQLPLSKRLIPSRASADPEELSYFAIDTHLSIHKIDYHIRNESPGWNLKNLRTLRKQIFEKQDKAGWSAAAMQAVNSMNPEDVEYARQGCAPLDRLCRFEIPVYYFYQSDSERDGRPLDLSIICKLAKDSDPKMSGGGLTLFEEEDYYSAVREAIQPFFMDCILGGSPEWHRVKGMGHLNYSLAWHIELLVSRMLQGTMESTMEIFSAGDGANREDLEKILLRHNGILPEHVSLLGNRRQFDFNGILSVLNVVRQAAAKNTQSAISNTGDQSSDELEVQAMFRQGQISAQQSSRQSNWYDHWGRLGETMLSRFTSPFVDSDCEFYSDINDFQSELRRHGVPLYYCQPHNVRVTAYKITGDGNELKANRFAAFAMQNIAMFPAGSQQMIKRIVTGIMADDYELAETLVPTEDKPDADQMRVADGENNTCIVQGRPPQIADTDIDETHVAVHFQGIGSLLQQAQANQETFEPAQVQAFKALGAHAIAHIQRMDSMGKEDQAKQFMEAMNQAAKMAEKFLHNLQQRQKSQQQQPVDPIEMARLQLDQEKLALAREKKEFGDYKFERQQATKEAGGAMQTQLALANDARAEEEHRANLAATDVELALKVKDSNKPEPVPKK